MNKNRYYMFYKPAGCITARKDEKNRTVMDYFNDVDTMKLNPVGRLDKDTEGLLILTDDGKFNQYLMYPDNHIKKTYYFWALGNLTKEDISQLETGVFLRNQKEKTKPAKIQIACCDKLKNIQNYIIGTKYEKIGRNPRNQEVISGYITISQGKKHQVKRMLKAVGCYVIYLKRVSIGPLKLDESLKRGKYRALTDEELKMFSIER